MVLSFFVLSSKSIFSMENQAPSVLRKLGIIVASHTAVSCIAYQGITRCCPCDDDPFFMPLVISLGMFGSGFAIGETEEERKRHDAQFDLNKKNN